ncbi:MAG TPA: hypothetical protein PKC30_16250 [Saprospiraceae bacterium]|nr:hypothetical protein [Saprospiraceae bacterium]
MAKPIIGFLLSPPAFLWEDSNFSIGGRQIHITEVDEIIKQIRSIQ